MISVESLEQLIWLSFRSLTERDYYELPSSYFTQSTSVVQADFFKRTESIS